MILRLNQPSVNRKGYINPACHIHMVKYIHTQAGYLTLTIFTIPVVIIAVTMYVYGLNWVALLVLVILIISAFNFSSLTVKIERGVLEIRFGIGMIRKRFPLREIESCRKVRNRWYYGWGIRLTPHGWLYNVSGLDAVEIRMKSGKKYRIGTDEPEELMTAILRCKEG